MRNLASITLLIFVLMIISCSNGNESCSECELTPAVGPCNAAIPIYYYDQDSMKCLQFIWGGCSGVVPFETLEACQNCDCN